MTAASTDRAAFESWLRANGAPWLVVRDGFLGRWSSHLRGTFAIVAFAMRWFIGTLLRSRGALVAILPLLLVAVFLSFFSSETWQTVGGLHGLPLILILLLLVALGAGFIATQYKPDLVALATFETPEAMHAQLPAVLEPFAPPLPDVVPATPETDLDSGAPSDDPDHAAPAATALAWGPALNRRERANLMLTSALAQIVAATAIAVAVAAFFVLVGLISVSVPVTQLWIGHPPEVWARFTLAGHEYALTAELVRVSVFLSTFAGFYFVVSAATNAQLREKSAVDREAHLRTVLAVRAVYRGLPTT